MSIWRWDDKADIAERSKNRKLKKALNFLRDLRDAGGLDGEFTLEDVKEVRRTNSSKSRSYYGKGDVDYLLDLGLLKKVDEESYEMSIEGIMYLERQA